MLRSFRACAAVSVLWTVPVPAIAAQPFEGRWAEDPAWCAHGRDDRLDEQPIVITNKEIAIYVSWCRIDKVTKTGDGFRLRTMCREEGEETPYPTEPKTFMLIMKGEHMEITTKFASWDVQRCPRR